MGSGSIKDIYAAGKGSLFDEVVHAAGGINAFKGKAASYARMSAEGVLELNPDVIIDLVVNLEDKGIARKDVVVQWDVVGRTNAVKNGRVHVLANDYVVIPGPRIVFLVEELARLFHPDVNWES
jgi:iron complex transport system substrate-binding protein